MKFSENFVFKLKSSCDIYSIFSTYVELKVCGANMRCCCPFHSEKTPSCFVYGATQSFYCFGCGVGGDVITFIEKIENLSYIESIKFLAKKVGVSVPDEAEFCSSELHNNSLILKINRVAALFFHRNLLSKSGAEAINYLNDRGILKKTLVKFGLGYSSEDWSCLFYHLKRQGFSTNDIVKSGLVLRSKSGSFYDKFRGRVMFPIVDLRGEVLGFGGRIIKGAGPKYLNSAESSVFKKGFLLYGLNLVKKAYSNKNSSLILCEGYMDVVSLHQNGFVNSVATLGTALTKQQVLLVSRNATDILLAYDSDEAGQAATERACNMFDHINFKVRILNLKGAKDPDEFLKKNGAARFSNLIKEAVNFEQLFLNKIKIKFNSFDAEEKRVQIHKLCIIIAKMSDSLKREVYINRVCLEFGLTKSVVVAHVNYLIKKNSLNNKNRFRLSLFDGVELNDRSNIFNDESNLKLIHAQEGVIRLLFNRPGLIQKIDKNFNFCWFSSSFLRKVFEFLVNRIKAGCLVDLSGFREILNDSEFGYLSKILNVFENYDEADINFNKYISILDGEFQKKGENILKMSLSELELRRQKNAKLKF